jgi:hypothetical protein
MRPSEDRDMDDIDNQLSVTMRSRSTSEDLTPPASRNSFGDRRPPKDDDDADLWALFESDWKVICKNLPDFLA